MENRSTFLLVDFDGNMADFFRHRALLLKHTVIPGISTLLILIQDVIEMKTNGDHHGLGSLWLCFPIWN